MDDLGRDHVGRYLGHALEGEAGIPNLGGGEALAGGVVGVLPEIKRQLGPTFFDAFGLALEVVGEGVVAGVDGGLADVVGLLVLVKDVFVGQLKCLPPDPGGHQGLQTLHERHEEADGQGFRNQVVSGGEVGPMFRPFDFTVALRIELAAKLAQNGIERGLPAPAIEVGHGQINNADVARDVDGLEREPFGQKVELRWNRGDAGPWIKVEKGEDEFSPSRGFHRRAGGVNPAEHFFQLRPVRPFAKEAKRNVGDGAGKDGSPGRFLVESNRAVRQLWLQKSGHKAGAFVFRNGPAGEMGGDDVKGQKEVRPGVGDGPAAIGHLSALQEAGQTTGRLADAVAKFGGAHD